MDPNERERVIDQWLDAAMKQYGQVEPRAGLENRVLAHVRAERRTAQQWRWWPALAALTAILLLAAGIFVVKSKDNGVQSSLAKGNNVLEQTPPRPRQMGSQIQEATHPNVRPVVPNPVRSYRVEVAAAARREQFPTPQPLSQQEAMLARYIEQFPREASLMAQAQTQLTRQEMIERETPLGSEISSDSEQNQ
jgi:hypothetical protein